MVEPCPLSSVGSISTQSDCMAVDKINYESYHYVRAHFTPWLNFMLQFMTEPFIKYWEKRTGSGVTDYG